MDREIEIILQLQAQIEKFPKEQIQRIRRVLKYTHQCADTHTQQCCAQELCKSCYAEHIRTSHPGATHLLEKISLGTLITAKYNEKNKEDSIRSPEIQATSKGRIKCCGSFRSQNRHLRHSEVHHSGESQEEILKYKDLPETQRVSNQRVSNLKREKVDPITLLSREQLQKLIQEIQESQRTGKYYE